MPVFQKRFSRKHRRTTTRTHPPLTNMPSKSLSGAAKRSRRRARVALATDTQLSSPQDAIPGLPDHLVVTHVLRSENFDDHADLARLPAVSRAMRGAVAETGLMFEELDDFEALNLGCLSAVQRLQWLGRLPRQEYLCQTAARGGHLEELKGLRADDTPWDAGTCSGAARGGHLEMLQWVRTNGCPWDKVTCRAAAAAGHLEVLQ
jgi:hypothetical protein